MPIPSFFEGPEKKLELVVTPDSPRLRALGESAWREIVHAARADVVSVLRNEKCDAYLLSESSLFVFDDYCVMITCGLSTLVDAFERLLREISQDAVAFLIYERKNENFPDRQSSTFDQDARRLQSMVPGRALRFGDGQGHYLDVFHSSRPFVPETTDPTLEVLMHGIDDDAARLFGADAGKAPPGQSLARTAGIDEIVSGFDTDEHVFEPKGYSLNALRGEEYYTVHVTPEKLGSYVSFETNHDFRGNLAQPVGRLVEIFRPRTFDVVSFLPSGDPKLTVPGYHVGDHVAHRMGGYDVTYLQYYLSPSGPRAPHALPL